MGKLRGTEGHRKCAAPESEGSWLLAIETSVIGRVSLNVCVVRR